MRDFEDHIVKVGLKLDTSRSDFLVIAELVIGAGTHAGKTCAIGIRRSDGNPWVPENAVHVRPHLVTMGQAASQASPLGGEWQYLSRRFDRPPSAKNFLTHILTVVGEL